MKKVIAIVGPTAVGKTKLSVMIAKHYNLEIISGDSVAVYKTLDIGSAKPTILERQGVKHHLIDILEPTEQYDVSHFQTMAREIIAKNDVTIIAGGTGLYVKSALYDYNFSSPKRDENFLEQFAGYTNEELYAYLLKLDPGIDQEKLHMNNRKRVLRALEVKLKTDTSLHQNNKKDELLYDAYIIYLNISDRDVLYRRIEDRVDEMVKAGLVEEVRNLYNKGIVPNAIGYKEFVPYFNGEITISTALDEVKKNSRHLAKRQMTWFKNQLDTHFYEVNLNNIEETYQKIIKDLDVFLEA